MKLTRFSKTNLLLLALFWIQVSQAQNIQTITPANTVASANEIVEMFGDLINVTASDIANFYSSTWDLNPYTSCDKPVISITNVNDAAIQFEWTLAGGGTMPTSISYMRLSTVGSLSTSSSTGSVTIPVPNNDLYLFIFQSECNGGGRSAGDIVIIDKPVLLYGAPCHCKEYEIVEEMNGVGFSGGTAESYLWPDEDQADYLCRVNFDQGTTSELRFFIQFNEENGSPQSVGSYFNCYQNIELGPDLTFFSAVDEGNNTLGTFTFSTNLSFSFIPSTGVTGDIYLRRCKDKKAFPRNHAGQGTLDDGTSPLYFRSRTNPVGSHTQLSYNLPAKQNTSIVLYNALGHTIKVLQAKTLMDAGEHELNVDLSHLPGGLYFCVLQTREKNTPIKLYKQ